MAMVIGVRFKRAGKVYFFEPGELEIKAGDALVVETARGIEYGEAVTPARDVPEEQLVMPLRPVVRVATPQDTQLALTNSENEKSAYEVCQDKIANHNLEMKLVDVEYAFDGSKILFYFTANGRVDFRALVKDLASVFKTRIELRQIGVRDEAKMLGGLGPCGRPICCGQFLGDFQPVSIKMAKEQSLSLNPTKISGLCGRLMCCLKYEQENYETARKRMPRIGREIMTPDGYGTVVGINVLCETVKVRVQQGDAYEVKEFKADECTRVEQKDNVQRVQKDNRPPVIQVKREKFDANKNAEKPQEDKKPQESKKKAPREAAKEKPVQPVREAEVKAAEPIEAEAVAPAKEVPEVVQSVPAAAEEAVQDDLFTVDEDSVIDLDIEDDEIFND